MNEHESTTSKLRLSREIEALRERRSNVSTGLSPVFPFNPKGKKTTLLPNLILPKQPWMMAVVVFVRHPCFGSVPTAKQETPAAMQPARSRAWLHTHRVLLQSHRNDVWPFRINPHELFKFLQYLQ